MEKKEEERLQPQQPSLLGGESWATIVVGGKAKEARIRRDANGNITYIGISENILGIF